MLYAMLVLLSFGANAAKNIPWAKWLQTFQGFAWLDNFVLLVANSLGEFFAAKTILCREVDNDRTLSKIYPWKHPSGAIFKWLERGPWFNPSSHLIILSLLRYKVVGKNKSLLIVICLMSAHSDRKIPTLVLLHGAITSLNKQSLILMHDCLKKMSISDATMRLKDEWNWRRNIIQ